MIDYETIKGAICKHFCEKDPSASKNEKKVMCQGCVMTKFTFANREIPLKEYFQQYKNLQNIRFSRRD